MATPTTEFETLDAALRAGDDQPFSALMPGCAVATEAEQTGMTLLHNAVRLSRHVAVEQLLAVGADANAQNRYYRRTPLHYAALESDAAMVELLLAGGAAVDAADSDGMTPLLWAPTNPRGDETVEAIIDRLLEAGANIAAATEGGHTALHRAAFEGSLGATIALLLAGAEPNPRTDDGVSPLHIAAGNGAGDHMQSSYAAIIERLLAAGADVNAQSTSTFYIWETKHAAKRTPLDVAKRHRHTVLAELLESRGGERGPKR